MADIRINSLPSTATSFNTDDYIAIDGASGGTRKMLAANPPFTDVTLGTSGPSVKSSLSARAPRQGLVFDGTAGATVTNVPAFGTGDFTVVGWLNPTSLSVGYETYIVGGSSGSFAMRMENTTGVLSFLKIGGGLLGNSTTALSAGKNTFVVFSRSGSTNTFYFNGVAVGTPVSDSTNYTTGITKIGDTSSVYPWNGLLTPLIYNRALSASEVVALYEAGAPSGADYNSASNTSIITGANSDFSSDTGYWAKGNGATISGGKCNLTGGVNSNISRAGLCTNGKKWRVTFTISTGDATGLYISDGGITALIIGITGTGTKTYEFTGGPSGGFQIVSPNGTAVIDDLTLYPIGLLLAPDAAQAGGGLTWYDTSGNAANITLPASGVSWNVPTSGYVTSGSSLNLSAGGTNQNITLTPSGTGSVVANTASGASIFLQRAGTLIGSVVVAGVNEFALSAAAGKVTNLYANGYGAVGLSILANANVLVGKTIDSSNGRFQLADHSTSAGGIGFGADTSFYRTASGSLAVYGSGTDSRINFSHSTSTANKGFDVQLDTAKDAYVWQRENRSLFFGTNNTTALTLDSSQNATFAGRVISNGTGYGVGANSDANTPFNALTSINGTFGALIKNTNAGSSAFAGINIEADSGQAGFRQYSTAHSVWAGKTLISAPSGGTGLVLLTNGTGDAIDFWTNATQALSIDASQNIVPGTAALATTATNGFIYLQTCAGAPTGVPTSYTGRVASIYDTTNNKLYIYNGGWKSVTLA